MCASEHRLVRGPDRHPKSRAKRVDAQNRRGIRNQARVGMVRNALIDAGVPAGKIQTGSLDNPQLRREGRVAVLISSR
jgi:hypothetical protein